MSRRRERAFWRGASQEDRYEYLVDSPYALDEIRQFHEREERVLIELLQYHVEQKKDIAFIEVGSGPGRIIRRIVQLILENPSTWGEHLKFIVGVDFEFEMIRRAIESLIQRERKIRNWTMRGTAHEVSEHIKTSVKEVKKNVWKRIFFIDANVEKPYLRTEGITPIIGIMFGTLGNIRRMDQVLSRVGDLCWPNGEALIVVFNREDYHTGVERYNQLARREFEPLRGTVWDDVKGEFTSPQGFYSRWFFYDEFKELLQAYFQKDFETTPLGKSGFFSIVKPKPTPRRVLANVVRGKKNEHYFLQLRCPNCANRIEDGTLPLHKSSELECVGRQKHRFSVKEYMGFRIPLLEVE